MTDAYDEATLDLLRLTIPTYGILVPIILQSGTNEVIDGRHRLKIREELEAEGTRVMLPVHHVDTNNPAEIDQIVNSVRRPWQDAEQRRDLVSKLREKGHSHQRIADAVGTHKKTVQNDLKAKVPAGEKAPVSTAQPKPTTGKDGKTKLPPATPEEIARAWVMLDAGKGKKEIAVELSRGYSTVREWFNRERPGAVQQGQPQPTASVPSAKNPTVQAPEPVTPTGKLNPMMVKIAKRERKASNQRVEMAQELAVFSKQLTETWETAQKEQRKTGAGIYRSHVQAVERQLAKDQCASIEESLRQVLAEAKKLCQAAQYALRLLQFDGLPHDSTPT